MIHEITCPFCSHEFTSDGRGRIYEKQCPTCSKSANYKAPFQYMTPMGFRIIIRGKEGSIATWDEEGIEHQRRVVHREHCCECEQEISPGTPHVMSFFERDIYDCDGDRIEGLNEDWFARFVFCNACIEMARTLLREWDYTHAIEDIRNGIKKSMPIDDGEYGIDRFFERIFPLVQSMSPAAQVKAMEIINEFTGVRNAYSKEK